MAETFPPLTLTGQHGLTQDLVLITSKQGLKKKKKKYVVSNARLNLAENVRINQTNV